MKKIFSALLCVFFSLAGMAQANKFTATLNPFSFAERDGGFTPGIGYNINSRLAIYADLGVIFFSAGQYSGDVIETNKSLGYKIKPAIRFYLKENKIQSGGFIELEGMYKRVTYHAVNEVDVLDNNGDIAYTYIGGYKVKKDVYGFNFKIGNRLFFDKEKKLGLDLYIGLGSRTKKFETSGLPVAARFDDDIFSDVNIFNFFWQSGRTISLPAGAKLFYNF